MDSKIQHQTQFKHIRNNLNSLKTAYDPEIILKRLEPRLDSFKDGNWKAEPNSDLYKALTLSEFQNGPLLLSTIPEQYKTFAIDMLRNLQDEYSCTTVSEKATVELIVLSFVRILELQRVLNYFLEMKSLREIDMKHFSILSKELDRANRQYTSALQTLKMLKQPTIKVNINANTAVVGQNQVVQTRNHVNKPI